MILKLSSCCCKLQYCCWDKTNLFCSTKLYNKSRKIQTYRKCKQQYRNYQCPVWMYILREQLNHMVIHIARVCQVLNQMVTCTVMNATAKLLKDQRHYRGTMLITPMETWTTAGKQQTMLCATVNVILHPFLHMNHSMTHRWLMSMNI